MSNALATPAKHQNISQINTQTLIGGIDVATGKRTGFEALKNGFNLFGADAKVLICPQFDKDAGMKSN